MCFIYLLSSKSKVTVRAPPREHPQTQTIVRAPEQGQGCIQMQGCIEEVRGESLDNTLKLQKHGISLDYI